MQALFIVLGIMLSFLAPRNDAEVLFRWQLASAIVSGTEDIIEQRMLTRIAWYESNYLVSVASCKRKGDHGKSHGTFQIQPRNKLEKQMACGTLNQQVSLALTFIRRSRELCSHLPEEDQLSLYTTGKCQNNHESQIRWNAKESMKLGFMNAE